MSSVRAILRPNPHGGFRVEVPSLPGCTAWGGTRDEVMENIYDGLVRAINHYRALGRPIPWQPEPTEAITEGEVVMLEPIWDIDLPEPTPEEEAAERAEAGEGSDDLADILLSYGIDVRKGQRP
jgi:predicted RNase H-like HicB family nuclease